MAKEGVLQRLELMRRDNGCISWGPDFTTVRGTMLQDGLLQSDQQLYQFCTLQIIISREDGPHDGTSSAEPGSYGMLFLHVLVKQHAWIGEGLAAFRILISHLPGAIMVSPIKDHSLCFWTADGEAIGCTEGLMGSRRCCSPCPDAESNATSPA